MKHYQTQQFLTTKNKEAEVYYREAIKKELFKYLDIVIKSLKKEYTPLKVISNSPSGYIKEISKLLNTYKRILDINSRKLVNKWLSKVIKGSRKNLKANDIIIDFNKNPIFVKSLKLIIERNVNLITNIGSQELNNINNIITDSQINGKSWIEVEKQLKTQYHITGDRAKLISRDQTAKINEAINEITQKQAGIEYFIWNTAHDERVSTGYGGHRQLNGKIFRWNEEHEERLPIIDSYGHRGYPAQRPNCRCIGLALILDEGYKVIWNGREYIVVKK